MIAKTGWRIHTEPTDGICASAWTTDGDAITVKGFSSRIEAWMFVALYLTFMIQSREDSAVSLLREFTSRARPS